MRIRVPDFGRQAKLYVVSLSLIAGANLGVHNLLKVLYILRLGFGPEYVGWFNAVSALTYSIMGLPSGAIGRKFGPRRTMLIGGIITTLSFLLFPLAEFMPGPLFMAFPLFVQVLITAGWSLANVNQVPALLNVTPEDKRDQIYSWNQGVRGMGTFLGTFVGGLLPGLFAPLLGQTLDQPLPYGLGVACSVLLGLAALVPLWMASPTETPAEETSERAGPVGTRFPILPVGLLVGYVLLRHGGWATAQGFFAAYMDEGLQASTAAIGAISSIGMLLGIVGSFVTPRLARKYGNGAILISTTLWMAIGLVVMAVVPHWLPASVGRMGIYVLSAIWLPTVQLFEMEMVAPEWRTIAYGALSMAMGGAFGISSLVGGYIVAGYSYRALFVYGVALSLLAGVLITFINRNRDRIVAHSRRMTCRCAAIEEAAE